MDLLPEFTLEVHKCTQSYFSELHGHGLQAILASDGCRLVKMHCMHDSRGLHPGKNSLPTGLRIGWIPTLPEQEHAQRSN